MSDKITASRTALVIVLLLITTAVAWFFWPSKPDPSVFIPDEQIVAPVKVQASAKNSPGESDDAKEVEEQKQEEGPKGDFRVEASDYATVHKGSLFTTSSIEDLVPDEELSVFRIGQKVFVYAEIKAPRQEKVRFTWFDGDRVEILPSAYVDVEMNMSEVGFRVYSYRSFRSVGDYRVAIFNSTGAEIGSTSFSVK